MVDGASEPCGGGSILRRALTARCLHPQMQAFSVLESHSGLNILGIETRCGRSVGTVWWRGILRRDLAAQGLHLRVPAPSVRESHSLTQSSQSNYNVGVNV